MGGKAEIQMNSPQFLRSTVVSIRLFDFLTGLSGALDLISPEVARWMEE